MGESLRGGSLPERAPEVRLESWKEIAAYLNRDVTTVQRWEKREGMTVRRHVHDMRGSVYAFRAELDAWAMLEIEPGHIVAQALVANAHAWAGQREKAIGECERALGLSQSAIARLVAACAYAQIGKTEEARRVLEEAESAWKAGDPDVLIAAVHAHLGAKDAAFRVAVVAF